MDLHKRDTPWSCAHGHVFSDLVFLQLPNEKKALWKEPSMYGRPDRQVILEDKSLQRHVFQTIANPNVILRGGKIIGVWMAPVRNRKMTVSFSLWGSLAEKEKKRLKECKIK